MRRGPYRLWMQFCERGLQQVTAPTEQSGLLWTYANLTQSAGDLDLSLALAERKVKVDVKRGEDGERGRALAWSKIADIRMARGDLDEALRIRLEEQLPVYERLSDVRERAVTLAKITQIHAARENYAAATQLLESEVIPLLSEIGDEQGLAVYRAQLAIWLLLQDTGTTARATVLFHQALLASRRMRLALTQQIEASMKHFSIPTP